MAGRSRKVRKYRAAWEQQQRDLAAAVNYQQNIINAYSTSPSLTTRFNYQTNQQETGFYFSDPNIRKGYPSQKRGRGRDTSSDVWIQASQIPAWKEGLKAAAINAELFGLPAAQKAQQSALSWDQVMAAKAPYMSQRTLSRNAALKAASSVAKAAGLSTGTMSAAEATSKYMNPDGSVNQLKVAQQKLSDATGITTFNLDGSVSTKPTSVKITERVRDATTGEYTTVVKEAGSVGAKLIADYGSGVVRDKSGNLFFGASTPTYVDEKGVERAVPVTELLSPTVKDKQQAYSNEYGIVTFDASGRISTVPQIALSGEQWKNAFASFGLDTLANDSEKTRAFKANVTKALLASQADVQLNQLNTREKEILSQKEDLTKKKTLLQNVTDFTLYGAQGDIQELDKITKQIEDINSELIAINNEQTTVKTAYTLGNYNELMEKFTTSYEDTYSKEKAAFDFMRYSDPTQVALGDRIESLALGIENIDLTKTRLKTILTKIENIKKNKGDLESYLRQVTKDEEFLGTKTLPSMNFDNIPKGEEGEAQRKQLETFVTSSVNAQLKSLNNVKSALKAEKQSLSVERLTGLSNQAKVSFVQQENERQKAKKEFEDVTGINTKGKSEAASLSEWLQMLGIAETSRPMKALRSKASTLETAWYEGIFAQENIFNISMDERQLSLYGETDAQTSADFSRAKSILSKYNEWKGESSKFASELIGNWKKDLTDYYDEYLYAPTVTKSAVARDVWGTSDIEGDSYVGYVAATMGGVRGGDYWIQDTRNLLTKVKDYETDLQSQLETRRAELTTYQKEDQEKQAASQAAKQLITQQVSDTINRDVKPTNVDQNLINKLSTISNEAYVSSYNRAGTEAMIEYLEKSIDLTQQEREELEKLLYQQEFYATQEGSSRPTIKRVGQSPGRPSLQSFASRQIARAGTRSQQSNRNGVGAGDSTGRVRGRGGVRRSRGGLGGLVV